MAFHKVFMPKSARFKVPSFHCLAANGGGNFPSYSLPCSVPRPRNFPKFAVLIFRVQLVVLPPAPETFDSVPLLDIRC